MTTYWRPAYGHPDGDSSRAWFRIECDWGYRMSGHPYGASDTPCLRIVDGIVYPTFGLPHDEQRACFVIVGSFVYAVGVPGAPWFSVHTRTKPLLPAVG